MSTLLLLAVLAGLLAGCLPPAPSDPDQTVDEALLLMLSSHSLLAQMPTEPTSSRSTGLMALLVQSSGRANEARRLADWYQHKSELLPQDDEVRQHFIARADEYYERAKQVEEERARDERRRQRGLLPLVRPAGAQRRQRPRPGHERGHGFAGAVLEYVIEEEIPARIRAAIRAEWERIRQLAQGRIEVLWQRLADRYGDLAAGYLRDRVDPLFIRLRDQVTGRTGRNARRTQAAKGGQATPTGAGRVRTSGQRAMADGLRCRRGHLHLAVNDNHHPRCGGGRLQPRPRRPHLRHRPDRLRPHAGHRRRVRRIDHLERLRERAGDGGGPAIRGRAACDRLHLADRGTHGRGQGL